MSREEGRDLMEQVPQCQGAQGSFEDVSKLVSYHQVGGMCLSVEQILEEDMLTLCLREDTV
jgi:hypothetical protein